MKRKQIFVTINNSNFINNYAHTFGSAFYLADKIKHLRFYVTQCLFYRNWANYNAAIWLNYNSIDGITFFISSQFIESWSDFTSSIEYECESGISYIKNCSFLNNTASWSIRDSNYFEADNNNDYSCGGVFGINAKSEYLL